MNALIQGLRDFISRFSSFSSSVVSVFNYILSIFKTIWYGLTSLLSGIWDLIVNIFSGSLFDYVGSGLNDLTFYIGVPAVVFISSLLFIIILRIGISFVFKLFRLNVDYHTMKTKRK